IAGDLSGIRTAFRVARAGHLKDAVYTAAFEREKPGWRLKQMTARGHLSHGRVTLPGILADLEEIDGDVAYAGQHVDFKAVSGRFQGISFADLAASIDWRQAAKLAIDTPSADIDTAIFYPWLTGFRGLESAKAYIAGMTGGVQLSRLKISGPLNQPADWQLAITGTPEALRLTTPRAPFPIVLSGGKITYVPGAEGSSDVTISFLDAVVVASHHSQGIAHPTPLDLTVDGTLGKNAIEWLRTVLPIPAILQIAPPLNLSRLKVQWDGHAAFSLAGGLKTAGGIALEANLDRSSDAWQIQRLSLNDGHSAATLSADWKGQRGEVVFSGTISKAMATLLQVNHRPLVDRLDGDFKAHIDLAHPQKITFTGNLAGNGIPFENILPVPVVVDAFSIAGNDPG
ncbi:hypothetical protein, partial [Desulfosarcina cetonica]|uniref:hypothetical protein n=1 Tax=Desulfosarcina cetonica TaxID=90730 RepID=UPI00155DDC0B